MITNLDDLCPPSYREQWDDNANPGVNPRRISNSHVVLHLKCEKHYVDFLWKREARFFIKNNACPACVLASKNNVVPGENDLVTTHWEIVEAKWDWARNQFPPDCFTANSKSKTYWIGIENSSQVKSRIFPRKKIADPTEEIVIFREKPQVVLFAEEYPDLVSMLSENNALPLETLSKSSLAKVIINCSEGNTHTWETTIKNLVKRQGRCIYCNPSGYKKVLTGFNDLATTHPQQAAESVDTDPSQVGAWSYQKVIWRCALGHQWTSSVNQRVIQNSNCPYCAGQKVLAGFNDLATTVPQVLQQWSAENTFLPTEITAGSESMVFIECFNNKNHIWKTPAYNLKKRFVGKTLPCPQCNSSSGERELQVFVESFGEEMIVQNRKIISPLELDIYLPKFKIAIEYNGYYWHSENAGKDSQYHENKWKMCQEKGITLYQIWEDDWLNKPDVVKSFLAHKLGKSNQEKIHARKCSVALLDYKQATQFLNEYHIQGAASGEVYLGLKYEEELVAVMVFSSMLDGSCYLQRYATKGIVRGGFSRLLKNFLKISEAKKIITFAAHDVSDGSLYQTSGFSLEKVLPADYSYLVNSGRVHKFNYRKKRFKNDKKLLFDPSMTERELAILNNINRCWDSGKDKYVLIVDDIE